VGAAGHVGLQQQWRRRRRRRIRRKLAPANTRGSQIFARYGNWLARHTAELGPEESLREGESALT